MKTRLRPSAPFSDSANAFESTTRAIACRVPGLTLTVQMGVGTGSDGLPRTVDMGDRDLAS